MLSLSLLFHSSQRVGGRYNWMLVSYLVLVVSLRYLFRCSNFPFQIYVYMAASKLIMVKSKAGLTAALVCNVFFSLIISYGSSHSTQQISILDRIGITKHFQPQPTISWLTDYYPLMAMVLGVENTLAITRAIVATPVHLSVKERFAHGLSREGWSITKFYLMCVICAGLATLTFIEEIQVKNAALFCVKTLTFRSSAFRFLSIAQWTSTCNSSSTRRV